MALGVKGFFDEGGSSLYVVRTFNYRSAGDPAHDHGTGAITPPGSPPSPGGLTVRARFPGLAGNMNVTFTLRAGRNALVGHRRIGGTDPGARVRLGVGRLGRRQRRLRGTPRHRHGCAGC